MKSNQIIKNELNSYKENELIFASNLYREKLSQQVSEANYYKTLERMCASKELLKVSKGIYSIPKYSKYGSVPVPEKEIVSAFTENETGTVIGYSLYNKLNLTTQISKNISVLSSSVEGNTKSIRNITVYKMPVNFSKEVINTLHALEVLQNFATIQDLNLTAFIEYTKKIASTFNNQAFDIVINVKKYKKSTIAFFQEILNYYKVPNTLNEHLSTLSKYKYPKMEELYDIARAPRRF